MTLDAGDDDLVVLWSHVVEALCTYVDYPNAERAPLLFIAGGEGHLMPPKIQRSNAKHYKAAAVTEVKEHEGYAHLLPAQEGWEQIADDALAWAVEHAGAANPA